MSSAAAAAAMRSRPSSPTSVADVKTKRVLRRSSISSTRSRSIISGDLGLQHKWSSGSMSRRSFRDLNSEQHEEVKKSAPVHLVSNITQHKISESKNGSISGTARRLSSLDSERSTGYSNGPEFISCSRVQGSNLSHSRTSVNFSLPTESRPTSPVIQRRFKSPLNMNPTNIHASNNQRIIYDPNTRRFLPKAEISEFDDTNISGSRQAIGQSFTQSNSLHRKECLTAERNLEEVLSNMLPTLPETDKNRSNCSIQNEKKPYLNYPFNTQNNTFTISDTNHGQISSFSQVSVPNIQQLKRQVLASADSADKTRIGILHENSSLQTNQSLKNEISRRGKYNDEIIEENSTTGRALSSDSIKDSSDFVKNSQSPAMAPRKSVLKYMGSSHINLASTRNTDDTSFEEPSSMKKRVARVSFDDKTVIVDEERSKMLVSFTESGLQNKNFELNSDIEKTGDKPLKLYKSEVMKSRPKLPYFGSIRVKKKALEIEERCLVSPAESVNNALSSVSLVPLESPKIEKSKIKSNLSDHLVTSDLFQGIDSKNMTNTSNFHKELSSEKKFINDAAHNSKNNQRNFDSLQDLQEHEKATVTKVVHISEDRESASQNSLSNMNINISTTSLTSLDTLKDVGSSSLEQEGALPRRTGSVHSEALHIPGAWETVIGDSDGSFGLNSSSDMKQLNSTEKNMFNSPVNTTAAGNFPESYAGIASGPDTNFNSLMKPGAFVVEDESESESIYCDAMEYISNSENSSSTRNSIADNSCIDSGSAIFPTAVNRLSLNLTKCTAQNQSCRMGNNIDEIYPIESKTDSVRNSVLTSTETSNPIRSITRSALINQELASESKSADYHIQNQETLQGHPPFSLPLKSHVGLVTIGNSVKSSSNMNRLTNSENYTTHNSARLSKPQYLNKSRNSVGSFHQTRPTDKKTKLRHSMRGEGSSCQFNIRSPSSASKTSRRSVPYRASPVRKTIRFRFSRLGRRHFSKPTKEKVTLSLASRFTETSDGEKQISPKFKSRFIDSSDEDIIPNRKSKTSDGSSIIPKMPVLQNYDPHTFKNNNHFNMTRHSDSLVPQLIRDDELSLSSSPGEKNCSSSTLCRLKQPHRKQKGRMISILLKKKTSFNDNVRRRDYRELSALDKQDQLPSTAKIQNTYSTSETKDTENMLGSKSLDLSDFPIPGDHGRKIPKSDRNPLSEVVDESATKEKNINYLNLPSNSGGVITSLGGLRKKKLAPLRRMLRLDR